MLSAKIIYFSTIYWTLFCNQFDQICRFSINKSKHTRTVTPSSNEYTEK
jgi:hypothetical protein